MPLRFVLVVGLCVLLGIPVVGAMAASPAPSAAADPNAPAAFEHPGKWPGGPGWGFGFGKGPGHGFGHGGGGGRGSAGRGSVTITSIDGSKVGLTTEDGWTRTITVTSATTITKADATITVTDLAVGDAIGFKQHKNVDGSYTITAINVRTPEAGGEVTAVTSNSVTVISRDGTKSTITLTGSTTYQVGKDAGTKADLTVGSRIEAEGTLSGDTFTASRIQIQPALAGGEVTAKTSSTITVKGRDGKTSLIHIGAKTTFKVRGKEAATLADIAVGDIVIAAGTLRADGSLDATQVGAGTFKRGKDDKPHAPEAGEVP